MYVAYGLWKKNQSSTPKKNECDLRVKKNIKMYYLEKKISRVSQGGSIFLSSKLF